jgi:hypothetical protein
MSSHSLRSLVTISACLVTSTLHAQSATPPVASRNMDSVAVAAASYGYIDGLYRADSTLIERHVHPSLVKRGYIRNGDGRWRESGMTFSDLVRAAARWNKSGKEAGPHSPRAVEVLSVLDQTAVTRVTAEWGTDFVSLARYDDKWMIVSVVWQTPSRR